MYFVFWLCPILEHENLMPIRNQGLIESLLRAKLPLPLNILLSTVFMVCNTDTFVFSVAFHTRPFKLATRTAPYWWTSDRLRMMENNMLLVEIAWRPSDLCQITHVTENWMATYVICTSRQMKIGLSGVSPLSSFIYKPFALPAAHEAFWEEMKW